MMATATSRVTPPGSRRMSNTVPTSPPSSIAKGATARSAAATSSRGSSSVSSAVHRRPSIKGATPPINGSLDSKESLSISLKNETEKKEQLIVQMQIKDQTILGLTDENNNLMSSLNAAETRFNELYTEQSRMEEEMAARIEVAEKLRAQVRELEKEKRDLQRRYNEQTSTFEAERQAFYDNEQHLKSRIQSLTQARKHLETSYASPNRHEFEVVDAVSITSAAPEEAEPVPNATKSPHFSGQDLNDPESEPAEMTSLRLELSTLSTSYGSLQNTVMLQQTQLVELKRVNHELQEENESYMILLREKTLSGQFDVMRQVGGGISTTEGSVAEEGEGEDGSSIAIDDGGDVGSLRSTGHSMLERVEEEFGEDTMEEELQRSLESREDDGSPTSLHARYSGKYARRHSSQSHSPNRAPRGESLADLPITGPGLDLAAELGRAENKDVLSGTSLDERDLKGKTKAGRKVAVEGRKASLSGPQDTGSPASDLDALRSEVKSLKDANKALSLYASKIIDRIIAQEGFEHVLAVDYEKSPTTPSTATAASRPSIPKITAPTVIKSRPQSALFMRSVSNPTAPAGQENGAPSVPPLLSPDHSNSSAKAQRRSMSFDWKAFSMFGATEKKPDSSSLRPLTLQPGTSSITGARKLETYEDEEDRRERERLNATMKLMGIQPVPSPALTSSSSSSPSLSAERNFSSPASPPSSAAPSRFSFFRSRSTTSRSDSSSVVSAPFFDNSPQANYGLGVSGEQPSDLTQEALAHAEAQNTLAALDAQEKLLSDEIAKGRSGGFTEFSPRTGSLGEEWRSRRSKRSARGSGSTVWSAAMSRTGDEDEE